ncbi:uncharacterized protein LOC100372079 [Saccoglossus kowalevskii]|uniref:Uncharacterized protein LOC100372079 n=1 Tax=Saccoglossus kowalevskii TaxID=10224 RepID=A0ABM0GTK0_SACKO|nr:PREDICTED: uncharacterized protein LOC100372079 [Saccoglossus kowalevskii]
MVFPLNGAVHLRDNSYRGKPDTTPWYLSVTTQSPQQATAMHFHIIFALVLFSRSYEIVDGQEVCQEFYDMCIDGNYCTYMFVTPNADYLDDCPEFSVVKSDLDDMTKYMQKQEKMIQEMSIELEELKLSKTDQYEERRDMKQQMWDQVDDLDRHWQWIQRQQKQIDNQNELINEWQSQIEDMWIQVEEQNWVQRLQYELQQQQYQIELHQELIEAQQDSMERQQRDWEDSHGVIWEQMQDWILDHQNSLIESLKLAQSQDSSSELVHQQWESIGQLEDDNYQQQILLEDYQHQLTCLEDMTRQIAREIETDQEQNSDEPVSRVTAHCTSRRFSGYFHNIQKITTLNETVNSPPRDVAAFNIYQKLYVAYTYGKRCEIYIYNDNGTFSLHQQIEFDYQDQYEYLNHFMEQFQIQGTQYMIIGHASKFGHVVYQFVNRKFVEIQIIETPQQQLKDWEFFAISNDEMEYYLAAAINREMLNVEKVFSSVTNSTIYKWDHYGKRFQHFQNIKTTGARTVLAYNLADQNYLAYGSSYLLESSNPYNLHVQIFRFEESNKFEFSQTLPIPGWTTDIVSFRDDGDFYLLDVKFMSVNGTYNTASPIYKWDERMKKFIIHQKIKTQGATMACPFILNDNRYIAIVNAWEDENHESYTPIEGRNTMIHKRNEQGLFVPWQVLDVNYATTCEAFKAKGKASLMIRKNLFQYLP